MPSASLNNPVGSDGTYGGQTTTIVIFGTSGDLTRRKLTLSLCSLFCKGRLGLEVQIVGMARNNITTEEYRESLTEGMDDFPDFIPERGEWNNFLSRIHYHCGDVSSANDMEGFEETLKGIEGSGKPANRLYYLALPPSLYEPTILNLGAAGIAREPEAWRRVIIEKPFGADLASAQALNKSIHSVFTED
jgi:glucose-6-phosphate 1-dehydrogenase